MMYRNWDYGMTGGWGILCVLFWLVVTVDLVLLGIWLWKAINKK